MNNLKHSRSSTNFTLSSDPGCREVIDHSSGRPQVLIGWRESDGARSVSSYQQNHLVISETTKKGYKPPNRTPPLVFLTSFNKKTSKGVSCTCILWKETVSRHTVTEQLNVIRPKKAFSGCTTLIFTLFVSVTSLTLTSFGVVEDELEFSFPSMMLLIPFILLFTCSDTVVTPNEVVMLEFVTTDFEVVDSEELSATTNIVDQFENFSNWRSRALMWMKHTEHYVICIYSSECCLTNGKYATYKGTIGVTLQRRWKKKKKLSTFLKQFLPLRQSEKQCSWFEGWDRKRPLSLADLLNEIETTKNI
nr:unnamed protein product [Callosobruchus chinensis]